jgi:hypothetical protein
MLRLIAQANVKIYSIFVLFSLLHFSIRNNKSSIKNMLNVCTSAIIACDQNENEKQKNKAAIVDENLFFVISYTSRKRSGATSAPKNTDSRFALKPISPIGINENILPTNKYILYPGGCRTPERYGIVEYSALSPHHTVGAAK